MFRKFCNLFTVMFLSLTIVYLSGGAAIRQCTCSGKIKIVNAFEQGASYMMTHISHDSRPQDSPQLSAMPCMKYYSETLDDVTPSQLLVFKFSPDACTVSLLLAQATEVNSLKDMDCLQPFCPDKIPIPPRLFLSLKHSLLI